MARLRGLKCMAYDKHTQALLQGNVIGTLNADRVAFKISPENLHLHARKICITFSNVEKWKYRINNVSNNGTVYIAATNAVVIFKFHIDPSQYSRNVWFYYKDRHQPRLIRTFMDKLWCHLIDVRFLGPYTQLIQTLTKQCGKPIK